MSSALPYDISSPISFSAKICCIAELVIDHAGKTVEYCHFTAGSFVTESQALMKAHLRRAFRLSKEVCLGDEAILAGTAQLHLIPVPSQLRELTGT